MAWSLSTGTRNAMLDAATARVNAGAAAGTLKIYTGTRPASADSAATGTLLLTFTLADPAFAAAAAGSVDIDADPDIQANAAATGTAGWGRLSDSDGNAVMDGTVGAEINLTATAVTTGQAVTLLSGSLAMPAS